MLNSALIPLFDIAPAVLAHGNDEATGSAAAAPASPPFPQKRITTLFSSTLFATFPVTVGDSGIGAFRRGLGRGAERTRAGKQVHLSIRRYNDAATAAVLTGSFAIYGVNLPDALAGKPVGNAYATQVSETVMVFRTGAEVAVGASTTVDASALSTDAINANTKGWNWLVVVNGQIVTWSASALANNISFSLSSGVVTLRAGSTATVIPAASEVVVYKLATGDVTELLAAGTHPTQDVQIVTKQVMWSYWTTNQILTTRSVATINGVAE